MFYALVPISIGLGFLFWTAWGLPPLQALLAGLGMAAFPIGIVAVLAWRERKRP
mgnify:CR=1 FL=1